MRSLIRDKADLLGQLWRLLEFALQLGTFFLFEWLTQLVPLAGGAGFVWDILGTGFAILLGALLPSLLLPSPTLWVRWTIDDVPADGTHPVDLRHRKKREFVFRTDLHVTYNSILGLMTLNHLIKKFSLVTVEFAPPASARLKRQSSDGGATFEAREARIHLPVTKIKHDARQSMFHGSAKTVRAGGVLSYTISASLGSNHSWFIRRFVRVRSDVDGLTIAG